MIAANPVSWLQPRRRLGLGAIPGATQTFTAVAGGLVTAAPAGPGTELFINLPPAISVLPSAQGATSEPIDTCLRGRGCAPGDYVLVTLDGTPGAILVIWFAADGTPGTFAVAVPGGSSAAEQGGAGLADRTSGGAQGPTQLPLIHAPGATQQGASASGGASLADMTSGGAQANGPVQPPMGTRAGGAGPSTGAIAAPTSPSSTGTVVAIGAGVIAVGALGWWALHHEGASRKVSRRTR